MGPIDRALIDGGISVIAAIAFLWGMRARSQANAKVKAARDSVLTFRRQMAATSYLAKPVGHAPGWIADMQRANTPDRWAENLSREVDAIKELAARANADEQQQKMRES